jgi:hypothetical protein
MSRGEPIGGHARRRARIVLAALAALALTASLAFLLADPRPHARARASEQTANFDGLAAEVQANIAEQREQAVERSSGVDRHQLPDPDDQPPAAEMPAIRSAERLVRRWLLGYLPYEIGDLASAVRGDITATSTVALARSLLAHPPLIPPPQQQQRPPEGRLLALSTTITSGGRQAQVSVELTYGLEREGFHLTLSGGEHGWLVAAFHG